mgnify:CR=1 FL=1
MAFLSRDRASGPGETGPTKAHEGAFTLLFDPCLSLFWDADQSHGASDPACNHVDAVVTFATLNVGTGSALTLNPASPPRPA